MSLNSAQVTDAFLSGVDDFIRVTSPPSPTERSATLASSTAVTAISPVLTAADVGKQIIGHGIPDNTTVVSISGGGADAVISNAATLSGAGEIVWIIPAFPGFVSLEIGLFTGTPALSVNTVLSDLVQPAYPGYALAPLTVNAKRKNAQGTYIEDYGSSHFQPSSLDSSPVPITGYFVQGNVGGATQLLYAELFNAPVNLVLPTDAIDINFDGQVQNALTWGGAEFVG